jgi:Mor family transcriptional regulator
MTGTSDKGDVPFDKWHITLMEMIDFVSHAFVSKGKPKAVADAEAEVAVVAIYKEFRGSTVYIPLLTATEKALLHMRIFDEYDGKNVNEIAKRHGMSVQNVYRIIKKQRDINHIVKGEPND